MFAYVPRHALFSQNPVVRATKSVPRHLRLNNSYHEPFIPLQAYVGGSRSIHVSPLTWPSSVVVPRTSCRDDSVICCCSAVPLRQLRIEHRTETILLFTVVLDYGSDRRAVNAVHNCAPLSSRRSATVAATVFLRSRGVVSLLAFWRRLVASIFSAHLDYVFRQVITFHKLLLNLRGA